MFVTFQEHTVCFHFLQYYRQAIVPHNATLKMLHANSYVDASLCNPLLPTLVFWIWRLPCSSRENLGSFPSRLAPFFLQVTVGSGSPEAWHLRRETPPTACVWLDGPCRMMGGGRSFRAKDNNQGTGVISPRTHMFSTAISMSRSWHVAMTINWRVRSCLICWEEKITWPYH